MKSLFLAVSMAALGSSFSVPAGAQDLLPAMDPAQIGHGQVLSSMGRTGAARRGMRARRQPTQAQANA
jgi:hypothetical protein